jgi:two-component system chemotaxis response regulator CheY
MSKTILVVDDSPTMLMSLKSSLELAGFAVDTASDGAKALTRLASSPKPDLIITDVNMPTMDGMELIKNVRGLPGFRFTPILTLTTETQPEKRAEGKRLGATGWLVKPVAAAELVKVIRQVLPGA